MPKYIAIYPLQPGESPYMRLRSHQKIMRQFKYNKQTKYLQFVYSQMLLYRPFRNEADFHSENEATFVALFSEKILHAPHITKINFIKEIIMPHLR